MKKVKKVQEKVQRKKQNLMVKKMRMVKRKIILELQLQILKKVKLLYLMEQKLKYPHQHRHQIFKKLLKKEQVLKNLRKGKKQKYIKNFI